MWDVSLAHMGMLLLPWVPNIPCSVGAACCTSFHKPWEISSWSYIQKSRANEDQRLMDSFPSFQEVICFHRLSLSMEKETAPKTTKDVKENTMEINPSMTSEQENTLPMHPAWHLHPQSSLCKWWVAWTDTVHPLCCLQLWIPLHEGGL